LEATGRSGADDGFDARGWEVVRSDESGPLNPADDTAESDSPLGSPTEDRLWLIQCKREKRIGPKQITQYVADLTGRILRMEKARVEALSAGGVWLVCTSTYGTGEVPDNAKPLYAALGEQRPDLSKVRYGVVALGDSIYPNTFCFGGKRFDELLASLGARRIGERRLSFWRS
jgi:hypothetical protein